MILFGMIIYTMLTYNYIHIHTCLQPLNAIAHMHTHMCDHTTYPYENTHKQIHIHTDMYLVEALDSD